MTESAAGIHLLDQAQLPNDIGPATVVTVQIELDPGSAGSPPHRHSGPVFAYLVEGELIYELEGEPERIVRAGEAFWEPGGDVIHYRAANNLADARTVFVAVMVCAPGQELLTFLTDEEMTQRAHLRVR